MVVVPTFSKGENTNHPIVHGVVLRVPILKAPDVADGVHGPGNVPDPDDASKEAPEHTRKTAISVKTSNRKYNSVQDVILLHVLVKPMLSQVVGIGFYLSNRRAISIQQPSCVRPPKAIQR